MDCTEIRLGFMTGGVPSGTWVDEHLKACPQCRELFQGEAMVGRRLSATALGALPMSDATLGATESLLENERGVRAYLRSRSTRVRFLLSLCLPALFLIRELQGKRVPLRELGAPRLIAGLLLVFVLAVVLRSALRPLPIERRAARIRSVLALLAWCVPYALCLVPEARVSADDFSGGFAFRSMSCFAYGSALAAPSFALLWLFDRGPRMALRVWALGAATVALLANAILLLHCADPHRTHLLAGHLSIGLFWFAAVSLVARWGRASDGGVSGRQNPR